MLLRKPTTMFKRARLKLTLYYVIISVVISLFFSLLVYLIASREFNRFQIRLREDNWNNFNLRQRFSPDDNSLPLPSPPDFNDAIANIRLHLLLLNLIIITCTSLLSYYFAGKTLAPIKTIMDSQNNFIANASHELRTPLTIMRSEIETYLLQKNFSLFTLKSLLKSNLQELMRMQELVTALLHLSALGTYDQQQLQVITLDELLTSVKQKFTPLSQNKNQTLTLKIKSPRPYLIRADPILLAEAITIFLNNAHKFSPSASTIALTLTRLNENDLQLSIKDRGCGIAESNLPHIFEKFYQVDHARSRHHGYGLGLPLAQQIITLHHGQIKVHTRLGHGSTFSLILPLEKPSPQ